MGFDVERGSRSGEETVEMVVETQLLNDGLFGGADFVEQINYVGG